MPEYEGINQEAATPSEEGPSQTESDRTSAEVTSSPPSERGVPPNLAVAGIIVGLVLIFCGAGFAFLEKSSLLFTLTTCVGFGIVLASFGSTAGGSWAGWTATGAGALAILLFLLIQHYTPAALINFKKGQLRTDLAKIADLRIIDETPMYEYRDRTTASIHFILLDRKLRSPRISIQVDTYEKGPGREFFELVWKLKRNP